MFSWKRGEIVGLFSFFSKPKIKSHPIMSKCSFVIFTDCTDIKKGDDIKFTVGVCNKGALDVEIGLMECFLDYNAEQIDYKDFEDKIGGTKITFPSKRNSTWNARISRLGTGHVIPAKSTYVIGNVIMSTEELYETGDYTVFLSECQICSYEGFDLLIPDESNKIVFHIR